MPFASYVMQVRVLLHHRILRLRPADADRHGSGGVFAQRGVRARQPDLSGCLFIWGIALRPVSAGEGDGGLALADSLW